MKKKFLVPIMALAFAVTAGVNCSYMQNNSNTTSGLEFSLKNAFADGGEATSSLVEEVTCSDKDDVDSQGNAVTYHMTACTGTGTLECKCNCGRY